METNIKLPQVNLPLEWTAQSHYDHERSHQWYIGAGCVVLGITSWAIMAGAWSVAIVTMMVGGVYYLVRRAPLPKRTIRIEQAGVQFEKNFLPWAQCKDFWLVTTPLFTELHIARRIGLRPEIKIHTGNIDPLVIRAAISQFLPMRADQRERLLDALIRICKL